MLVTLSKHFLRSERWNVYLPHRDKDQSLWSAVAIVDVAGIDAVDGGYDRA